MRDFGQAEWNFYWVEEQPRDKYNSVWEFGATARNCAGQIVHNGCLEWANWVNHAYHRHFLPFDESIGGEM